ncbi:hypothetical protein [Streptomyces mobaraensis]|uniref:Uncharacterized protein n=1 Tax=Streptomyces mobaraensis TaxID=35621 RepID=A0A5N5W475_STRMB|nr:hypothetical protein [Streptomyces mobaraensis]KAB7839506.1 hypothetical protein FRZ00_21460 [Streptomyces mobaraensis]
MGASMLIATIAFPAESAEPPNFDRGRELLEKIEDPSLFTFDDPEAELGEMLPDVDSESGLVDQDGEVLVEYARRAGLAIIDNLEMALDSRETTFLTIANFRLYISGGLSTGGNPTKATQAIWDAYKLPESVLAVMGFIPDCEVPLSRANGSGNQTPLTDTDAVDAIALGLGTSPDWSGGRTLAWIADVIGKVRNHPGGRVPREYQAEFTEQHVVDPLDDSFLAMYVGEETVEVDGDPDLSAGQHDVTVAGEVPS